MAEEKKKKQSKKPSSKATKSKTSSKKPFIKIDDFERKDQAKRELQAPLKLKLLVTLLVSILLLLTSNFFMKLEKKKQKDILKLHITLLLNIKT